MSLRRRLLHTAPRTVEVVTEGVPQAAAGEVVVTTSVSAISAGTELLVYRNQIPASISLDSTISTLSSKPQYPFAYGYACAGKVDRIGKGVDKSWIGKRVFCFHPHDSVFASSSSALTVIPDGVSFESAVLFPNLETAVNLVQDAKPLLGEDVIVYGAGMVGLLTVALLAQFPLRRLVVVDPALHRRKIARDLGAHEAYDPVDMPGIGQGDIVFEVSGAPAALNGAISATRFGGRVVVGSWYGSKEVRVDLGTHFHRARIEIVSSQVSTVAAELSGRWNKARRSELVWNLMQHLDLEQLITHKYPIEHAPQAFDLLDRGQEDALQVLLTYGDAVS
jgi:2-desacetyl-2-hydroxyethyl bacteriochlorophyllide A dehydrogenase